VSADAKAVECSGIVVSFWNATGQQIRDRPDCFAQRRIIKRQPRFAGELPLAECDAADQMKLIVDPLAVRLRDQIRSGQNDRRRYKQHQPEISIQSWLRLGSRCRAGHSSRIMPTGKDLEHWAIQDSNL